MLTDRNEEEVANFLCIKMKSSRCCMSMDTVRAVKKVCLVYCVSRPGRLRKRREWGRSKLYPPEQNTPEQVVLDGGGGNASDPCK